MENWAFVFWRFDAALANSHLLVSESIGFLCLCKHFLSRI